MSVVFMNEVWKPNLNHYMMSAYKTLQLQFWYVSIWVSSIEWFLSVSWTRNLIINAYHFLITILIRKFCNLD